MPQPLEYDLINETVQELMNVNNFATIINHPLFSVISKVASAFYMNASYLGQCFRQQIGVKFTDYLNQYRIQKACELLEEDAYLTYEIKDLVGFKNQNYFHTVFRKITGVSTEEYRKQHLKKG